MNLKGEIPADGEPECRLYPHKATRTGGKTMVNELKNMVGEGENTKIQIPVY